MASKSVGTGRGIVFISFAKLWFMVAGYAIQFVLPSKHALGSAANFGIWVTVLAIISPFNNVTVTATIQSVSKFSSEDESQTSAVTRAALRMQAMIGGTIALLFLIGAPVVASFVHDATLVAPVRIASFIVLAYSFYAVFVGAANGERAFHKQAALDVTFSTLRAVLVIGAALITHAALYSIAGFAIAAGSILLLSMLVVGVGQKPAQAFPLQRLFNYFIVVAIYLMLVNLLMFIDGLLIKRLVSEGAVAHGIANATEYASAQAGIYGAAQTISRLPYQLILAVTFIIFPLVSRATFERDVEKTKRYVEATMRYSLLCVAGFAVVLGARPSGIMHLLYPPEYQPGSAALVFLLIGYVCFSMMMIAGTIFNGAGRTRVSTVIAFITLIATCGITFTLISAAIATGHDPLAAAGIATMVSMAFGLVLCAILLLREFGSFIKPRALAAITICVAGTVLIGRLLPHSGFWIEKKGTLACLVLLGGVYGVLALGSGALRLADLRSARQ